MREMPIGSLVVFVCALGAGEARASFDSAALPAETRNALGAVLSELDGIERESRSCPDAAAADRIRKLVERARGTVKKLVAAEPGAKPPAGSAGPATAGAAAGAPPPPPAGSKPAGAGVAPSSSPGTAMAAPAFKDLLKAVKGQTMDGGRLAVVRSAIDGGGWFSSAQVVQLVHVLTGSETRVEAAAILYPRCLDPGDYSAVYSRLDSDEARARLRSRIEGGAKDERMIRSDKPRKF